MIDESKYEQYGFPRSKSEIQGITIHETSNTEMSAKDMFDYLNNVSKTSQGCHYFVDNSEVIEVMPLNWGVYHTGKGMDMGNRYTIAIEICDSLIDEHFEKAVDNAVELIKLLQDKYHIGNDMVFFHNDFNEKTYCPNRLLDIYKSSKNFVKERLEV